MRESAWVLFLSFLCFQAPWTPSAACVAQEPDASDEVPEAVRALEGAYTGSWTMFGIDEAGEVVPTTSWTDRIEAGSAAVEGGRAFVETTCEMTFAGGQIPPFKIQGREGYVLKKDGGLGKYFIETAEQTYHMVKVGENVWSYTTPATGQELVQLGFPGDASGQHVMVKVVAMERGVEVHRISRLTTVRFQGGEEEERVLQFVSLQGYHRRADS